MSKRELQQISVSLPEELRRALEEEARRDDRPLAQHVRRVLTRHVAARGEREPAEAA